MWIHQTAFPASHNIRALTDQKQSGCRQSQTETGKGICRAKQGGFELKAVGFIIKKVLFDVKTEPILIEGCLASRLIADDVPDFADSQGLCQR